MAGRCLVSALQQLWRVFAQALDIARNMLMTSDIISSHPPYTPAGGIQNLFSYRETKELTPWKVPRVVIF